MLGYTLQAPRAARSGAAPWIRKARRVDPKKRAAEAPFIPVFRLPSFSHRARVRAQWHLMDMRQ